MAANIVIFVSDEFISTNDFLKVARDRFSYFGCA